MSDTIDVEAVESTELEPRPPEAPALFGTTDPADIITKATAVADVLKAVIVKQGFALKIGQSEYIKVEGWTTLGALLGVFPKVESTRPLGKSMGEPNDLVNEGWEAAVVVVNSQGVEIGRAEAMCLRSERNWKNRDDFALRSMAQTRAMGKALRMPLGWIAVLAGYEATPAEEMPSPAVDDKDVPFDDKTGGVQGRADEDRKAHGEPGTDAASETREEALERRRLELTEQLSELATKLGKRVVTDSAIGKDWLKNQDKPAAHLVWLEKQIEVAAAKVAEQEEQLPI